MTEGRKRRVLITGAGGRIGDHLATTLQDRYSLRLQYNKTMPETPPVDDWVQADIANYDQIAPAMEGIDAVIHMAGEPSPVRVVGRYPFGQHHWHAATSTRRPGLPGCARWSWRRPTM